MAIEQKRYDEHPVPEAWANPDALPFTCPSSTVAVMVTGGSLNGAGLAALPFGMMGLELTDISGNQIGTQVPIGTIIWGRWSVINSGVVNGVSSADVAVGYRA